MQDSISPPLKLTIATRESRLALWQAKYIRQRLLSLYPHCQIELLGMTTRGDSILDRPLAKIGGKGLFVKELEAALLDGRADLAVHSMKDVPMQLADSFSLASICERETPLDAFVCNRYASLADLPPGAVVGTSSLRREAQLRAQYPYLAVSPLRGNLDTRLRKLDAGQFDAIILAAAGLIRLDLATRIRETLTAETSLPAVGQGALGIETISDRDDLATWLAPLHHIPTAACVSAERALSAALAGSCELPLGAYAQWCDGQIWLRGLVARADGSQIVRAEASGNDPIALGLYVAQSLLAQGAKNILAELGH